MSLTSTQTQAISARGNVLLVAGAGTGKTHTLVERVFDLLEETPPTTLDEMLLVTFTEAAAAEMRERIAKRFKQELDEELQKLRQQAESAPDEAERRRLRHAESETLMRWQESTAQLEMAHIGTLHSICLQLVRQHFYELELDPQLSVLAEEEARLLAAETLEAVLQAHYAGRGEMAEAVQQLIQSQGRGSDEPIRRLVLRLHHYTQTWPDPDGWFRQQLNLFASPEATTWQEWLLSAMTEWRAFWLPLLEQPQANEVGHSCAAALQALPETPSRAEAADVLQKVVANKKDCPHGKKADWLKPLREFFSEAEFLLSLARVMQADGEKVGRAVPSAPRDAERVREVRSSSKTRGAVWPARPTADGAPEQQSLFHNPAADPLAQDWDWVRTQMSTLLRLAQEFNVEFSKAKRELGVVDFHDLEQHALRLLWDTKAGKPTPIALQWRQKLRFVFVDEYQDINAAQDKIIEALSREGAQANRFLVGDVKQSIYRFRLANPAIFQEYVRTWGQGAGQVIPLTENFRSRESILDFVNSLFGVLMRPEIGGVLYDEQARLRFGAATERRALSAGAGAGPAVELHLRLKGATHADDSDEESNEELAQFNELEEADKEARLVALRLRELKACQHPIWDERTKRFRPVDWSDMAVLLRSPSNKAESYAKEFSRLKVPLLVERGGFYQSQEIADLLSLLQTLDNPLQDLPVLAVLHSPLVGLTVNELATIRLTMVKARFWTALVRWKESVEGESVEGRGAGEDQLSDAHPSTLDPRPSSADETLRKVTTFLERFARWRRLARQVSLSRCLEAVLTETHYGDWLLTQSRGEQRHANVQRLLSLAQQFDLFQRQGLFRFLRFIEAQQLAETEPEVAAVSEENSVRLMSIHQAKGLEFPVVVVADLGKPFNLSDLRADVILDSEYGLCPQVKPPHTGKRYPSLPYWLASRRQLREVLGEELRLLYVAMTRARDWLLLSASISKAKFKRWSVPPVGLTAAPGGAVVPATLQSARCYADWLGAWFALHGHHPADGPAHGENAFLRWTVHDDKELSLAVAEPVVATADTTWNADATVWQSLQQRLSWHYRFPGATRQPAKTSVSALRRQANDTEEDGAILEFQISNLESRRRKTEEPKGAGDGKMVGKRASILRPPSSTLAARPAPGVHGADIGTAHHLFLQHVLLQRTSSAEELKHEAKRLEREGALSVEQGALLDFRALAAFWNSDLGRRVRAQAEFVRRELAFTARFSAQAMAALTDSPAEAGLEGEFVVVQGVADLAVLLPEAIWLVDFKTDRLKPDGLDEKCRAYEPQLRLYAEALAQIYQRPVTESWLYFLSLRKAVPVSNGS
jgi:ATP-dependent helicase/nuclease subunit A